MFTNFYQKKFTTNLEVSEWYQTELTYPSIDKYKLSVLKEYVCDAEIKKPTFDVSLESPWPIWVSCMFLP